MGLFDKIFKPQDIKAGKQAYSAFKTLTAYEPVFTTWDGAIYESELVRSAVDARARNISKLKLEIVGNAKPALQTRLRLGPNPWMTYSQFLYRTSTILDCKNTCFIVPVYDKDLSVIGIYPVIPTRCKVVEYKGEPWLRYEFKKGEHAAVELKNCAVLTHYQFESDFFGESNRALDETMKLIHMQNEGIQEAVRNGATYRFMARLSNFAKPEDIAKERERFSETNFGREAKGGGMLLFPNTYNDIKQISQTPYTIDEKQMEQIRTNVFNYFGVNKDVLQNAAYGDAWSAFYEGAIEPFAIQLSETLTKMLFSERERANGAEIMVTSNRLQYLSNADKLAVSAQMADRGLMSINEIREIWNLAPVEGGDVRPVRGEYYFEGDSNDENTEGQN